MKRENSEYKVTKLCEFFTEILYKCDIKKGSRDIYDDKTKVCKMKKGGKIFSEGNKSNNGSIGYLIIDLVDHKKIDKCVDTIRKSEFGFAITYDCDEKFDYTRFEHFEKCKKCKENCCHCLRNGEKCSKCSVDWIIRNLCKIEDDFDELYLAAKKCNKDYNSNEEKGRIEDLYNSIQEFEKNINSIDTSRLLYISNSCISLLCDYKNSKEKNIYIKKRLVSDYKMGYVMWYTAHLLRWPRLRWMKDDTGSEIREEDLYPLLRDSYIILKECYREKKDVGCVKDILCRVQSERIISYLSLAKCAPFWYIGLNNPYEIILQTKEMLEEFKEDKGLDTLELKVEFCNFCYEIGAKGIGWSLFCEIEDAYKNKKFGDHLEKKFILYRLVWEKNWDFKEKWNFEEEWGNRDTADVTSKLIIDIWAFYCFYEDIKCWTIIEKKCNDFQIILNERKSENKEKIECPSSWIRVYGDIFVMKPFLMKYYKKWRWEKQKSDWKRQK